MPRIISLGWGVQSFALAVMAALGDIELVHPDQLYISARAIPLRDLARKRAKTRRRLAMRRAMQEGQA